MENSFINKSHHDPSRQLGELSHIVTDYCLHAPLLPGHYGCVEALVTWGADVDMDIPHLGTALYTACVCQELECARKLLREGQPHSTMWIFTSLYRHAHVLYEHTQTQEHTVYYKHTRKLIRNHIQHIHTGL